VGETARGTSCFLLFAPASKLFVARPANEPEFMARGLELGQAQKFESRPRRLASSAEKLQKEVPLAKAKKVEFPRCGRFLIPPKTGSTAPGTTGVAEPVAVGNYAA
jgi:hypothetical protein